MSSRWRWADRPWPEVGELDRRRVVAILPVGAVEAHGPHLPLATDVVIAEAMARAGAERLAAAGYSPLLLPALAYSPAPFAAGFPGTISIRPRTLAALVEDVAVSVLASYGAAALAVANAHLDPAHLGALHAACDRIAARGLTVAFPDLTRRPWAPRLTEEFRSGACHAGRFEGSIVLATRPEQVREDLLATLEPNPVSLSRAIRDGKTTFEEAGGASAYFGDPAAATAEEGRATVAELGRILEECVRREMVT
ncbi:MAG: creatininase family protein [Thermoanaerobaculia bacterium]|nr:creatininase family protein [Thermoanaerobaculia bacterium]